MVNPHGKFVTQILAFILMNVSSIVYNVFIHFDHSNGDMKKGKKSLNGKLEIAIEMSFCLMVSIGNKMRERENLQCCVCCIASDEIDFLMICNKNPLKFSTIFFSIWPVYLFSTIRDREWIKRKCYRSKAPVVIICNTFRVDGIKMQHNATQCNMMQSLYSSLF